MADHTPTPWKIHSGRAQGAYGPVEAEIRGANFVTVRLGRYSDQVKADAAFIVRSCNAHTQLMEALEAILIYAKTMDGLSAPVAAIRDTADIALKNAKGGTA